MFREPGEGHARVFLKKEGKERFKLLRKILHTRVYMKENNKKNFLLFFNFVNHMMRAYIKCRWIFVYTNHSKSYPCVLSPQVKSSIVLPTPSEN